MRKIVILSLIVFFHFGAIAQETAKDIVKKADEKTRGLSSKGEMTMTIVRPTWERTIKMKSWTKGTEYAMVLISYPAKEKGQVFLKRGTEMWNWISTINRMIKLPPSMMSQGWMGSDFTNDDMIKQSSIVVDYTHTLIGSEIINGIDCYKIELIPKEDAAVVWGKIIMWVSKTEYHQLRIEFYDEDNDLMHTQIASEIKMMGGKNIASKLEIIPADNPEQKTIMTYDVMAFDILIEDAFFSQQNMKRIK